MDAKQSEKILNYIEFQLDEVAGDLESALTEWKSEIGSSSAGSEGIQELAQIGNLVRAADYGPDRITLESSIVRGLEYYTGPVFEVDLTFSTDSKDGSPRFGSVGGGGRYQHGLISRFRSEPLFRRPDFDRRSRLLAALEYLGKVDLETERGPVGVVTVFDQEPHRRLSEHGGEAA